MIRAVTGATHDYTLAALGWKSPRTLARSLASWATLATANACVQRLIYFQERTEEDDANARRHDFEPLGNETNVGIGPAYRALLDRAMGTHFLFLECDWRLVHPARAENHLEAAIKMIATREATLVRLRSRARPGWPVNPSQLQNRELEHPYWLLDSAYWEPHPDRVFPNHLRHVGAFEEDWIVAPAAYAGWTNNPHIARVDWLVDHVRPFTYGEGKAFEGVIDDHWKQLPIDVAQGRGLFTHSRIDGPGISRPFHYRLRYFLRMRLRRYQRPRVRSGESSR